MRISNLIPGQTDDSFQYVPLWPVVTLKDDDIPLCPTPGFFKSFTTNTGHLGSMPEACLESLTIGRGQSKYVLANQARAKTIIIDFRKLSRIYLAVPLKILLLFVLVRVT
jgi:hypothetical protein